MALESLAPDQRAVVQLVLQQERSYDDLAGLLGISEEAVRERAHLGLARLAPSGDVAAEDRAEVADYLLGQQPVARRAETRRLLSESAPARAWAQAVARELSVVARGDLPEIPEGTATVVEEPIAAPTPEPARRPQIAPEPPAEPAEAPAVRARPRPRPAADRPGRESARRPAPSPAGRQRSSLLGGAMLIGGTAVVLVTLVVWLVVSGGDEGEETASATPTPTATATPEFQPVGRLELKQVGGGDARGEMTVFATQQGALAFTIQGEKMPQSAEGEAYAVWLVGGDRPHRLGFAPPVGEDGKFGTSGPRERDAEDFPTWFSQADRIVVSRESSEDASEPGPVVLQVRIPKGSGAGSG